MPHRPNETCKQMILQLHLDKNASELCPLPGMSYNIHFKICSQKMAIKCCVNPHLTFGIKGHSGLQTQDMFDCLCVHCSGLFTQYRVV